MGILRQRPEKRRVLLSGEFVVGRLASCSLVLDTPFVSTTHALIRWQGDSWELRDLGSTNGTYIDGQRVAPGEAVRLSTGTLITFGHQSETWEVCDVTPPGPALVPMDGSEPLLLLDGVLAIHDGNGEVQGTVFYESSGWVLEVEHEKSPLLPGQTFTLAGREYRFDCPIGLAATQASTERPWYLDETTLVLTVSSDEEHVQLELKTRGTAKDLGERACFYLALVLGRRRIEDRESQAAEHGWLPLESLLKMVPDYTNLSHLNLDIFRLRRLLGQAGIQDAAGVIERRKGQLRLGTDRIELRRKRDG
ncbi:MAG TPA: FHA domain-containing protein [Polyangiaceae bacterium]|nr:FHA domain-containing protein [Polyangiaceae bacterium]